MENVGYLKNVVGWFMVLMWNMLILDIIVKDYDKNIVLRDC